MPFITKRGKRKTPEQRAKVARKAKLKRRRELSRSFDEPDEKIEYTKEQIAERKAEYRARNKRAKRYKPAEDEHSDPVRPVISGSGPVHRQTPHVQKHGYYSSGADDTVSSEGFQTAIRSGRYSPNMILEAGGVVEREAVVASRAVLQQAQLSRKQQKKIAKQKAARLKRQKIKKGLLAGTGIAPVVGQFTAAQGKAAQKRTQAAIKAARTIKGLQIPHPPRRRPRPVHVPGLAVPGPGRRAHVQMLQALYKQDVPPHKFPYAPGTYIFDEKDNLGFAEAFRNAASIANPLAKRSGTQRQIGRHIDMKVGPASTFIVIHKGCPPKSIKILAAQIQSNAHSLVAGHVELFEDVKNEHRILMSAERLKHIHLIELADFLYKLIKQRKHYVKLVLHQTAVGGAMQHDEFHTPESYRNLLLGY